MSPSKPLLLVLRAPNGIRTRVTAVKGRCPRPLDDGDVSRLGNLTRQKACNQTALITAYLSAQRTVIVTVTSCSPKSISTA